MKVLVTGGEGFIGGHLVDRLVNDGCDVVVMDDRSSEEGREKEYHVNPKVDYEDIDLCDLSKFHDFFMKHGKFDYIYHLAAVTKIQESLIRPGVAVLTNVLGTANMLEFARFTQPKKFVFVSSCAVYGLNKKVPFKEDLQVDCLNPYSLTKNMGEDLCSLYNKIYNVETVILRYFNVFGPRAPEAGSYTPVVSRFLSQKKKGETLTIVGDGEQTRDYVHVEDVVEATLLAAASSLTLSGQVFNVGSGKEHSVMKIAELLGYTKEDVEFVPQMSGECRRVCADNKKIKKELGWKPKHKLESYIKEELKKLDE